MRPREFTVRVEWAVNTDASKTDPRTAELVFAPATDSGTPDADIQDFDTENINVTQAAATPITGTPRQKDSTALMAIARSLNVWDPWDGSSPMSTWSDVRLWEDGDSSSATTTRSVSTSARALTCQNLLNSRG